MQAQVPPVLTVAVALLTAFAPAARGQLLLSPDKIVIRCSAQRCTGGETTLKNVGSTTVTISSISIGGSGSGSFAETNNCGSMLAPGASCTIRITVAPGSGDSTGFLVIDDNAPNSPQKALLRVIDE